MYCSKCGKEIDNGVICYECYQKEQMAIMEREKERLEKERLEKERIERERLERERLERERIEKERLEKEQLRYASIIPDNNYTYAPKTDVESAPAPRKNNIMLGFGPALTSTILGFVGFIIAYASYYASLVEINSYYGDPETVVIISIILNMSALPFAIISLCLGIKSIKTFKSADGLKPIPSLILGINAITFCVSIFLFMFASLCLVVAALSMF